ncbi:MBL fold metallo-hydrolase [Prochlorococcus marinus]|uniref:MBL fold metallo-hydrolase n=1 Tax=Prochlorococcus marinus TaxID=1219 RepID=UPI001ADBF3F8|nr:MBL fold metallo-hydrolase [Prochlorococcus marinus]MBO8219562.1 MBL fold metallo-hydrolase [Prochlorococcus marinus CUG1416]MBW3051934.1 hypothetical protein [Prochlorococcus marinus str. MU1416]
MSELRLHTCGNATLILEKNSVPILATDPWLDIHTAYFGSWCTSHKIPKFHFELLQKVPFIWISHFHPDHLNLRSLLKLKAREKTILLSYQYCNRVAEDLRRAGMKVVILPPRQFINIEDDLDIATFPILSTVDSILLIRFKQNLVINSNDTSWDPSMNFIKKEVAKSKSSLLLKLAGYGDADMINIYDEKSRFIEPIAATKPAPGFLLTSQANKLNCTHAMHFSSFHKYIRKDSLWANKYTTPENDLTRGWNKNIGYFKQFSSILINEKGFMKLPSTYPDKNDIAVQMPQEYGDNWDEELSFMEEKVVINYLNKIEEINKNGFSIKVGKKIISSDRFNIKAYQKYNFILNAPRKSLLRAIRSNIFDDLLIGNFAKIIITNKKTLNFRNTLKIPSKYVDNVRINDAQELKQFLWAYRNSYDSKLTLLKSDLKIRARDIVLSNLIKNTKLLGKLKNFYQKI